MNDYTLEDHLRAELSGLSPYYSRVFDYLLEEYFHRTHLDELEPSNSLRRVNYLIELGTHFWNCADLWEIQTIGIEFNLQAELDNNPELLEVI